MATRSLDMSGRVGPGAVMPRDRARRPRSSIVIGQQPRRLAAVPAAPCPGRRCGRTRRAQGWAMPASGDQDTWITDEERSVLADSATGLSITEVAELLGLPPEAVRRTLGSA